MAFLSQATSSWRLASSSRLPFRSMLLTLRGGPESLAPRAHQIPVSLMVFSTFLCRAFTAHGAGHGTDTCPGHLCPPTGDACTPDRAAPRVWGLGPLLCVGPAARAHRTDQRPRPSRSSRAADLPVGGPLPGPGRHQPSRLAQEQTGLCRMVPGHGARPAGAGAPGRVTQPALLGSYGPLRAGALRAYSTRAVEQDARALPPGSAVPGLRYHQLLHLHPYLQQPPQPSPTGEKQTETR